MLTKEALRGAIIGTGLFNETEGCIELDKTQPNDSDIGGSTVVFLDGEYQPTCIYANKKEGYIVTKSKKGTDTKSKETIKGDVLILFCSDKILKLLKHDRKRGR